jgi:hypothetical protein
VVARSAAGRVGPLPAGSRLFAAAYFAAASLSLTELGASPPRSRPDGDRHERDHDHQRDKRGDRTGQPVVKVLL